jgi:hypothetical protein
MHKFCVTSFDKFDLTTIQKKSVRKKIIFKILKGSQHNRTLNTIRNIVDLDPNP